MTDNLEMFNHNQKSPDKPDTGWMERALEIAESAKRAGLVHEEEMRAIYRPTVPQATQFNGMER